uniref:Uncharacterized protein LOC111121842 isoform X2 n=1 Tax=Crassostrea virginica TaxID=6565 RepID=A0A8B8CT58_CRAVI|nr:uncharacterized protein LOC111121842 isoform X2 [Crassostrea virginica]
MPRGDRVGKSKGSGIRCVAANCGNTNTDGVSMHTFPKDAALRKEWTDFVKLKSGAWVGPTEYSALCSAHFSADCYSFIQRFETERMGIKPKKITLNPDAIPTIHALTPPSISSPLATSSSTPKRSPYKRPFNMLSPNEEEQCQSSPPSKKIRSLPFDMLSPNEEKQCQSSLPKKISWSYTKRETNRTTDSDEETLAIPMDVPTEPEETYSEKKKSACFQFNYHPKHRSKYCQTSIKENHKKMVSVGDSESPRKWESFLYKSDSGRKHRSTTYEPILYYHWLPHKHEEFLPKREFQNEGSLLDIYEEFDTLSHITTLENASSILQYGFKPRPVNDSSVVNPTYDLMDVKTGNKITPRPLHPIGSSRVLWYGPCKFSQLQTPEYTVERYGNILFSMRSLDGYEGIIRDGLNFYFIEVIEYMKSSACRILVSHKDYPSLKRYDPYTIGGPLYIKKLIKGAHYITCVNSNVTMEESLQMS